MIRAILIGGPAHLTELAVKVGTNDIVIPAQAHAMPSYAKELPVTAEVYVEERYRRDHYSIVGKSMPRYHLFVWQAR